MLCQEIHPSIGSLWFIHIPTFTHFSMRWSLGALCLACLGSSWMLWIWSGWFKFQDDIVGSLNIEEDETLPLFLALEKRKKSMFGQFSVVFERSCFYTVFFNGKGCWLLPPPRKNRSPPRSLTAGFPLKSYHPKGKVVL